MIGLRLPRPRRRQSAETSTLSVGHDGVRVADPYAFEVAHRRLAWVFRLSVMINAGLFAVVLVQTGAISALVPLQRVELGLIRIEPATDRTVKADPASLVRVLPVTKTTEGFDLVMESFVRRYVRLLLEIDSASQGDRMREANLYSDGDFWKRFMTERRKDIEKATESGLNRSVVIESASRISERNGVYRYLVSFDQVDGRAGKPVESKKLHAYLAVASRPHTVRESEKFENPLGFRVLDVAVKLRGNL